MGKSGNGKEQGNKNSKRNFFILLAFNLFAFLVLLTGFEIYLDSGNLTEGLPPNGMVEGQLYTWGHKVENNRFGFREREFKNPKPEGVYRIMVLGDSLTFGVGLRLEERYTARLERMLGNRFPGNKFEVLNFGFQGGPTIAERDLLRSLKDKVTPDRIIVGFCLNDLEPRGEGYSLEKEEFLRGYYRWFSWVPLLLKRVGFQNVGTRLDSSIFKAAENAEIIPTWEESMDRPYQRSSTEWKHFTQALRDIKSMSDGLGLDSPLFLALNQGAWGDRPTLYGEPEGRVGLYIEWYRKAVGAAREAGFIADGVEKELAEHYTEKPMGVNRADGHPNADLNRFYADKLFRMIEPGLAAQFGSSLPG